MGKAKVWKLGNKYAGISARGKRVVKATKAAAMSAVGLGSSSSKGKANKPRASSKSTKGSHRMGRKQGFSSRKAFSLAKTFAFFAPLGGHVMRQGTNYEKYSWIARDYVGYNPQTSKWEPGNMLQGWGPWVGVTLLQKAVTALLRMF